MPLIIMFKFFKILFPCIKNYWEFFVGLTVGLSLGLIFAIPAYTILFWLVFGILPRLTFIFLVTPTITLSTVTGVGIWWDLQVAFWFSPILLFYIIDNETKQPILNANITLTAIGSITNVKFYAQPLKDNPGWYIVRGWRQFMPPGIYDLTIQAEGYKSIYKRLPEIKPMDVTGYTFELQKV